MARLLKRAWKGIARATSQDKARSFLGGVFVQFSSGGGIILSATDGCTAVRIAASRAEHHGIPGASEGNGGGKEGILPAKALAATLNGKGDSILTFNGDEATIASADGRTLSRVGLVEGPFPNLSVLFDPPADQVQCIATVDVRRLADALLIVAEAMGKRSHSVTLSLQDGGVLRLTAKNGEEEIIALVAPYKA